jgi:hypothetical protein
MESLSHHYHRMVGLNADWSVSDVKLDVPEKTLRLTVEYVGQRHNDHLMKIVVSSSVGMGGGVFFKMFVNNGSRSRRHHFASSSKFI